MADIHHLCVPKLPVEHLRMVDDGLSPWEVPESYLGERFAGDDEEGVSAYLDELRRKSGFWLSVFALVVLAYFVVRVSL